MARPEIPPDGLHRDSNGVSRCFWGASAADYISYHDEEWGFPGGDDNRLFEKLSLEGFMAGLSWLTILRKRESFRAAFANFDHTRIARFGEDDVNRLLGDAGIVRHRGKIEAVINNARCMEELLESEGSLAAYVWRFEPPPRTGAFDRAALAARQMAPEAQTMAKDLKRRGWRFVGPTTVYSFMQAMGLVNDHLDGCDTAPRVEAARAAYVRPS